MKKLCVIILPAFLIVVLTSCAWLYQVTGVGSYVSAGVENRLKKRQQIQKIQLHCAKGATATDLILWN